MQTDLASEYSGGRSLASPAKYALAERGREVQSEREREATRWQWDGFVGLREKGWFSSPFVLFCFTQFPKRIREQINF